MFAVNEAYCNVTDAKRHFKASDAKKRQLSLILDRSLLKVSAVILLEY